MSNKVIIAAAGSGKTTHLIETALQARNAIILITTFTEENEKEIRPRFFERNGCIPSNVVIQTWFSFLLQHGVRPYQGYLYDKNIVGLSLVNSQSALRSQETNVERHYVTGDKKIYSDKIAKFACRCDERSNGAVISRLSKIYTHIFIDEVQDLAGYDLEFLDKLFLSPLEILLVGDPRQRTFSTNSSAKHKQFRRSNILDYFKSRKMKFNLDIDSQSLNVNHRCVSEICDFSNKLYPDMIATTSDNTSEIEHKGVYFLRQTDVEEYLQKYSPIQLRQSKSTDTHPAYPTLNFGVSKGLSFDRVLIYPTKPILDWIIRGIELKPTSKCKLYVAITRARYSVAILYDYNDNVNICGITKYK